MSRAPIEQIARDAELLPCPRCGYATNLHEDVMAEPMTFQPYCADDACGLQGKIFNNPFEAIKHWNRRQACGQQPAVTGYKLVPIEPTLEMQKAYFDSIDKHMDHILAYADMLAAAHTPPVRQPVAENAEGHSNTALAEALEFGDKEAVARMMLPQQPAPTGWRDISEAAEDEKLEILGCNQKTGQMWIGHMFKFPNPEVGWKFTANAVIRPATHWRIVYPPHPVRGGEQ